MDPYSKHNCLSGIYQRIPGRILLILFLLNNLSAESFQQVITFEPSDLSFVKEGDYDKIKIEETILLGEAGFPLLPVKPVSILLPSNTVVKGIRVISMESENLKGKYFLYPAQPPRYPGETGPFTQPDQVIYSSNQRFPSQSVQLSNHGSMSGYSIVNVLIYPIQYIPSEGLLVFHRNITFLIDYDYASDSIILPERRYKKSQQVIDQLVNQMVKNRHDLYRYKPSIRTETVPLRSETSIFSPEPFPSIEGSAVDYLIVTNEEMKPAFKQFADWKTDRGTPSVVMTMTEIKTNTPNGADDAETLRSFIREAYQKWGVTWVLLGGDVTVIPVRYVDIENRGETAISDLYFSDLDGNWNGDGDAIWGERLTDQVDVYPDVFIGRAPVETVQEAENFIMKTISYQQGEGNHYDRILYLGENLGGSPGDGMAYCEAIDRYVTQSWIQKTKLYEINNNQNRATTLSAMNEGQNIIYNVSHGNAYRILAGPPGQAIEYSDMFTLTNTDHYSIMYNVTCNANDISLNDCFAEYFILNPTGGGVAFIGSTWLDYPSVSRVQNEEFFRLLFQKDNHKLGALFAQSKLPVLPLASIVHYRQAIFTYLLLGDPELDIFIKPPSSLSVQFPATVPIGSSEITISVTSSDGEGQQPIGNANVCLEKKGEVYAKSETDNSGEVTFTIIPHTEGKLNVTVTGYHYRPYTGNIDIVSSDEPHAYCSSFTFKEISGNGDNIINSGEKVRLTTVITNSGQMELAGSAQAPIRVMLHNSSPYLFLSSDTFLITTSILSSQEEEAQFDLSIDSNSPDESEILLPVSISNQSGSWQDTLSFVIRSPEIKQLFARREIMNFRNICRLTLRNEGTGYARGVNAQLIPEDGAVVFDNNYFDYGDFLPEEEKTGIFSFRVENPVSELSFRLAITDIYGRAWEYLFEFEEPDKPKNLRFQTEKDNIVLIWDPVTKSDIAGYYIYRSRVRKGSYKRMNRYAVRGSSMYRDSGLGPDQVYYYRVSAIDSSGNESRFSIPVQAWTQKSIAQGWPKEVNSLVWAGPTVADIDGDNDMEIFICGTNGTLYALHHDGTELINSDNDPGTIRRFAQIGASLWSSPAIGDLDGDGTFEVVVTPRGAKSGETVYSWHTSDENNDGEPDVVSGWPTPFYTSTAILASPVLASVDEDNALEVITMDQNGYFYVWEDNGTLKEGWPKIAGSGDRMGQLYSTAAVGNLDNDPENEIVACGGNRSLSTGAIYIWNHADLENPLIFTGPGPFSASPILADLDDDGELEIVAVSEQHTVYVFESNGDFMDGWENGKVVKVMNIKNQNRVTSSPAVGDLDQDGELEIVVPGLNSIAAWHADGSVVSGFPVTNIETPTSIVIADVDGLIDREIIVGSGDKQLYAFKSDGSLVQGFPISVNGPIIPSPVVSDMDGDGLIEILWACDDSNLYMVNTNGRYPWIEWGGFHNNMANTGLYTIPPQHPLSIIRSDLSSVKPETFALYQNFPNPFNPSTSIGYYVPERSFVTISIYNLLGQKIRTLVNKIHQPGFGSILWDSTDESGRSVSAGIYFYTISAQRISFPEQSEVKYFQSRKMLLLK